MLWFVVNAKSQNVDAKNFKHVDEVVKIEVVVKSAVKRGSWKNFKSAG